ncbi:DAK2 domain-containing protein [Micromonospora sp. NPDC050686]|uniref:DAK2 domain-containing protein n=1 Tax=Micromonospora sp. NPDC050686 TaxID=3154631 RepID=UPI0034005FF6
MLETLDAAAVRRWCASGLAALRRHQGEIDDLNVYPVPDGDTGTNLVLTLTSAQQALAMDLNTLPDGASTAHGHALRLMAQGALLGARGNSGVILSQILRGFADALAAAPAVRGRQLAAALRDATAAAYAAVASPVEGTLLSVVAAAAEAAERADSDDLRAVARAAAAAAARALARTPEQLPVLARAGVVDAGGQGLCLLLDALVEVITGESPARPAPAARAVRPPAAAGRETGSDEYAYEVQFLLDADAAAVDRLRAELAVLGDSLVVVGDGRPGTGTWNVHVHVNDVGAAIEAGVVAGRPYQISVTRFADQVAAPAVAAGVPDGRAAVVVAPGAGIADLFAAEGATVVPANPSIGELLDAVRATRAARVVVLPNDPNTQAVANAAAREAHALGVKVSVVPTRSPVQALAALAVRDPQRRFEDDVIAMAEAAGACRYAEVCHAGREALTVAGPCRPGDVLALVEGEVHLIGADLVDTCTAVVDRMLGGGGELVTLLSGADAPPGLADRLREHVERSWPFVEVQAYEGGQPHYPLLLGVE